MVLPRRAARVLDIETPPVGKPEGHEIGREGGAIWGTTCGPESTCALGPMQEGISK